MSRRNSILILVAAALAFATPAKAQLGFITGMLIGSSLSSGDSNSGGGSSDVIYRGVFPPDRKFEWAKVRSGVTCDPRNGAIWDAATNIMKDPNAWDMIEIRRYPGMLNQPQCFVFTYYPKGQ